MGTNYPALLLSAESRPIARPTDYFYPSGFFNNLPERFQAKWKPVRLKKTRQIKESRAPLRFYRSGKGSSARASAAAAPVTAPDRPAAQPRIAAGVQLAAARNQFAETRNKVQRPDKVQRLAAMPERRPLAGADMAASAYVAARRPSAAQAPVSGAAGSAREP
jgi:hypothetical protein